MLARSRPDIPASLQAAGDIGSLEAASGGRLGLCLLGPDRRRVVAHRARESFPTASTIKFALSAAVLAQADAGALSLDDRIAVRAQDIRSGASVTGRHVGKDMTVRDLCRGSMVWSDNPAVGLLLPLVGGAPGLQAFLRRHGDADTRTDGIAEGASTTSPDTMARNLARFVLDDALSRPSRLQLADWLIENRTGDARIRAGMPAGWRVGDKTGGMAGVSNDIAVLWPPGGGVPWLLALYLQGSPLQAGARDAVLRRATELVAPHLAT
ncbi:class A beta-lactamase [Luteimonas sp. FCS-9]|uniref:class A beta-lactamase n=1 Tax=Luteimonas sp. FCS-9 TaxID=1547516 RepID=UPI001E4CBB79|nr:class A beta-lactamase [Luteimonas sp. FCS-9]